MPNLSSARKTTVKFDAFPDSAFRYLHYDAIACVDVLRATTTLVTAAAQGRRAFPAANSAHAHDLAAGLDGAILAGDRSDGEPVREMENSPSSLIGRSDTHRPLILESSIGTELIVNAGGCPSVYIACFRNIQATAAELARRYKKVAILGACSRGQLRCEDLMASAWICRELIEAGFAAEDHRTAELIKRWGATDISLVRLGSSAEYLRRTGQADDVEFVVDHVDDVDMAVSYRDAEVLPAPVLTAA